MRTTINLEEDALIAARNVAQRECVSLGKAVSELIRRGIAGGAPAQQPKSHPRLAGRFALLPATGEVVTPQHVRDLMDLEGI